MPDFEDELQRLRTQIFDAVNRLVSLEVQMRALAKDVARQEQMFLRHEARENERGQRIPSLLVAVLSLAIGTSIALFQLWLTRGP